jgi:transcriptional regulator with GAF, ATPase, and Fis domain
LTTPEFVEQYYNFRPFKMLRAVGGIRHVMAAPLWCGHEPVGFLNLASRTEQNFQSRDAALFKAFTDHAALAVRAVFANEKLRTGERELSLQRALQAALLPVKSADEFATALAKTLETAIPSSFLSVEIRTKQGIMLNVMLSKDTSGSWQQIAMPRYAESDNTESDNTELGNGDSAENVSTESFTRKSGLHLGGEFIALCNVSALARMMNERFGVESFVELSMLLPNGEQGFIRLAERQPYGFSEQDEELLERLQPHIALGWMSLKARLELERFASHASTVGAGVHTQPIPLHVSSPDAALNELLPGVIGTSSALRNTAIAVRHVAPTGATVLLEGETGTGKERIARAIHALSPRAAKPFVALNCAALPSNLVESELFGHEKGAFTGATERRIGKFEAAEGGTIFLDEVGELSPDVQAKLLRTLQERELERVGGKETIRLDVRVIAATNRSLAAESAVGRFRADLYYRLNVFPIVIAPLRERREDISLLVEYFVRRFSERLGKDFSSVEAASMQALMTHSWRGNIRELENTLERAAIISQPPLLRVEGLLSPIPPLLHNPSRTNNTPYFGGEVSLPAQAPLSTLNDAEREHILRALRQTNWRVSGENGAAMLLNMKATTLEYRMKKLGIHRGMKGEA